MCSASPSSDNKCYFLTDDWLTQSIPAIGPPPGPVASQREDISELDEREDDDDHGKMTRCWSILCYRHKGLCNSQSPTLATMQTRLGHQSLRQDLETGCPKCPILQGRPHYSDYNHKYIG